MQRAAQAVHGAAGALRASRERIRVAAFERAARERGRLGHRGTEQRLPALARSDQHMTAVGREVNEAARRTRKERGELGPARSGFDRIGGDREHAGESVDAVRVAHPACMPDRFGGEVLDELHAAFGHRLRRRAYDPEARAACGRVAFELQELGCEAVCAQPGVLLVGDRRAEAGEVHAGVAGHRRAQMRGGRRIGDRGEEFEIALLEHRAHVGGTQQPVRAALRGFGRRREAERFERAGCGAEIGNEVRNVIEKELARRRKWRAHAYNRNRMNRAIDPQAVTLSGAEAAVEMLRAHGVEVIFGLCGDTSLPFYDALARLGHGMRHVLARDERHAAYMADGYARVSGRVGVCEGPSGGGATYLLPGLVEANESSVPMVAINTDIAVGSRGRFALTELDQKALMRPLTKWNAVADRSQDVPRLLRAAFHAATSGRPGAAHLVLPFDVQNGPVERTEIWADAALGRTGSRRIAPDPAAVEAAARLLCAAERPVIVCGGGVVIAGAEAELARLAERLSAPVATSVSGQGAIADEHPLAVGVVGSNGGTPETRAIVDRADLVFFVGCRAGSVTTERWRHPAPGRTKVVHLDVDARAIGANYPTDAAIVADAKLGLAALDAALDGLRRPLEAGAVSKAREAKFARFRQLAGSEDAPVRPERVVAEMARALDADAILVLDPGTPCPYFSAYYPVRATGRRIFSNRAHGALGYALAAAIGAHFARPAVKTVAVMGDGSFGMCAGELETAVRLGLPITFVVLANAGYGWIKAGQRAGYGARYFSVDFSLTDHARVAEAFGVRSWRVADPAKLAGALGAALAHAGPSLVDIVCQPLHEARAPVSEWVA